jgi:hypothetical protein
MNLYSFVDKLAENVEIRLGIKIQEILQGLAWAKCPYTAMLPSCECLKTEKQTRFMFQTARQRDFFVHGKESATSSSSDSGFVHVSTLNGPLRSPTELQGGIIIRTVDEFSGLIAGSHRDLAQFF